MHYEDAEKLDPKNFGMSKSKEKKADVTPQPKPEPAPLPSIKSDQKEKTKPNFGNTVKALLTSSEERKEFWDFVKGKVFGG